MKKLFLLTAMVFLGVFLLNAQNENGRYAVIPHTSPNELSPDFTAAPRAGDVPLEVQFTDETEGGMPDSWLWDFGDGDTSNQQNPVHVYDSSGYFSVKLTVTDSAGSYSLMKENFILVEGAPSNCDTLNFPLSGNYTVYIAQDPENGDFEGYVSGSNSYGDLAKANYFPQSPTTNYLTGALLDFAIATNTSGNASVNVKAWTGTNNSGGGPVTEIASVSVPLQNIQSSIDNEQPLYVEFPEQTKLNNTFFIGVTLPQNQGDTIVLFTNEEGDADPRIGWEQWGNGSWYAYSDSEQSWGLSIANAIFPIVCETVGVEENELNRQLAVYPNPVKDYFTLISGNIRKAEKVALYDLQGQLLKEFSNIKLNDTFTINTNGLDNGVYFLEITTAKGKVTRKLIKSR